MSVSSFIFTLLLGLAFYPLVSNHNPGQRENALLVVGSLLLGFLVLSWGDAYRFQEGSFIYSLTGTISFLCFAMGFLNRNPVRKSPIYHPVLPITLGCIATAVDCFVLDHQESALALLVEFFCLLWLMSRYRQVATFQRSKFILFAVLYCSAWLAHNIDTVGLSDIGHAKPLELTVVYLIIGSVFLHMLWQDFSRVRTTRLSQSRKSLDTEAIRLSYRGRRVLKDVRHDLRQPISTLGILASVGKAIARDPEVSARYDHIQTTQRALKNMLEETFSQLDVALQYPEDTHHQFNLSKLDLNEVLDPLVSEYRHLASNKNLEMRFQGTKIEAISHREALTKILRNGLDNAIKYTNEGGVAVTVRRRANDIVIQIIDTGPGFEEDKVATHHKGWGHGSRIVRDLSEKIGVQTTLRNRIVGQQVRGSVFEVAIPNPVNDEPDLPSKVTTEPSQHIVAEILVNGEKHLTYLRDNLNFEGFDEVRFNQLNLYRAYASALRRGPASIYIAYATSDQEFDTAIQSLGTISRLIGHNPCCVVIYWESESTHSELDFEKDIIFIPMDPDNPKSSLQTFAEFFPSRSDLNNTTSSHKGSIDTV